MRAAASILLCLLAATAAAERRLTLAEYSREARQRIVSRIRETLSSSEKPGEVTGTVTWSGDEAFFLQSDTDGLKVVLGDGVRGFRCRPGDVVTVQAKPSLEGGRVVVVASECRRDGTDELPEAVPADGPALVDGGDSGHDVNWLRVEIEGRAIGCTEKGFAVTVDSVPVNVIVDPLPDFLADCDRTRPQVRVKGVAELLLDQSAILGRSPYVMGVKVNVASAEDIVLETDAVYLANRRDARFLLLAGLVLAGSVVGLAVFVVVVFRQRRRILLDRTVMAERKRMADDIHDTIEQHLVGAGMLIKLSRLKEAQDVLVRAKRELRDIVWGLKNDDMTRLTPAAMIEAVVAENSGQGLCAFSTALPGLPEKLDAAGMRDLSLIVREAIGNAIKHGGACNIRIASRRLGETGWRLDIGNDGTPFDPAKAPGPAEGHFGLEGMKERARRLRAKVNIVVEDGWTVVRMEKVK